MSKQRGSLKRNLTPMLYGFGDVEAPLADTVDCLEEITLDYINSVMAAAIERANVRGGGPTKVQTEDVVALIRKDEKKFTRVKELLTMHDQIKRDRQMFDYEEGNMKKRRRLNNGRAA